MFNLKHQERGTREIDYKFCLFTWNYKHMVRNDKMKFNRDKITVLGGKVGSLT